MADKMTLEQALLKLAATHIRQVTSQPPTIKEALEDTATVLVVIASVLDEQDSLRQTVKAVVGDTLLSASSVLAHIASITPNDPIK